MSVRATARSQSVRNRFTSDDFVAASYTLDFSTSLSKSSFINGAAEKLKSAELMWSGLRTPRGRMRSRRMQHHHRRFRIFLRSGVSDLLVWYRWAPASLADWIDMPNQNVFSRFRFCIDELYESRSAPWAVSIGSSSPLKSNNNYKHRSISDSSASSIIKLPLLFGSTIPLHYEYW